MRPETAAFLGIAKRLVSDLLLLSFVHARHERPSVQHTLMVARHFDDNYDVSWMPHVFSDTQPIEDLDYPGEETLKSLRREGTTKTEENYSKATMDSKPEALLDEDPVTAEHLPGAVDRLDTLLMELLGAMSAFEGDALYGTKLGNALSAVRIAAQEACRRAGVPWKSELDDLRWSRLALGVLKS